MNDTTETGKAVQQCLDEAKRQYLTKQKMKGNRLVFEDIWDYVNAAACERVVSGFVTVRLTISECQIKQYRITETIELTSPEGYFRENES